MIRRPPRPTRTDTLFPDTTLFRSPDPRRARRAVARLADGRIAVSFNALVLAGSRDGPDPVAAYAGVSDKALIEIAGATMLARVVGALRAAEIGRASCRERVCKYV